MDLRMENISMFFGAFQALIDVNFSVGEREIHGLLGENGAGKSTLMNILAGILRPAAGSIIIDGQEVSDMTTKKAMKMGIRFIHQELSVIDDLRVYENIFLAGELTKKTGLLNKKQMIQETRKLLERMNLQIDPCAYVRDLDTSRKQLVEIAKSIMFDAKLIIMDEPTTSLTNKEIEVLFGLMRKLRDEGVSLIYISHKMPELFAVCDTYTVLRDGRFIQSGQFKDINEQQMTNLLVGSTVVETHHGGSKCTGEVYLEAENLSCEPFFHDISFSVKCGEVVAITGLFGDGRGELSECLFGARKLTGGTIKLKGKPLSLKSISGVMKAGMGMMQRSRKERSVLPDLSILNNASMAYYTKTPNGPIIKKKDDLSRFHEMVKITNIRYGNPDHYITSLSGGNQQKVILARWLETDADVYILDNPTQGIDVGAKFEVYKLINEMVEAGKSIVIFSSEFPEIHRVCDRCIVMYKGRINAMLERADLTETNVMYYSTGANMEVAQ